MPCDPVLVGFPLLQWLTCSRLSIISQEETSRAKCLQREIEVKMAKGSQSTVAKPVMGPSSPKSDVAQGFCMHMSGLVRDKCTGDGISLFLSCLFLGLLFS